MKFFSDGKAYDYAVRRKLARGLLRWEASLGTAKQLRAPSVKDLLTRDEFETVPSRLIWVTLDEHHRRIWHRLYRRDRDLYLAAQARDEELSRIAQWESGAEMSARERAAQNRSSDMPLQPPVMF